MKTVRVFLVKYPHALLSSLHGLDELFDLANQFCKDQQVPVQFDSKIVSSQTLDNAARSSDDIILLPPCLNESYYLSPETALINTLHAHYAQGGLLCSVCSGAFILAATRLADDRLITTHWALADSLIARFPAVKVDPHRILVDDQDIITAGGLMSWVDLGLLIVGRLSNAAVMRKLSRYLMVDTDPREQRLYSPFEPLPCHTDKHIAKAQRFLHQHFSSAICMSELATHCALTERTFLRRFVKATGEKPSCYLQKLRIQRACDLLEAGWQPVNHLAELVGYHDPNAFTKVFTKITGDSPRNFCRRMQGYNRLSYA